MKLITKLIAIVMLAYSLTINAAAPFFPMEAYSCNYNEGKDLQDYLDVSEDWKDYADDSGMAYNSWVLTPHYYSQDWDADVYWIGFSPTWEQLAEAQQSMTVGKGIKLNERFLKVVSCDSHSGWAIDNIRSVADLGDGVLSLSDCNLTEEATFEKLLAADEKWNAMLDESGFEGGLARWWPGVGITAEYTYDFLFASISDSLVAAGKNVDQRVNGGGNARGREVYGDLVSCENERTYIATATRVMASE
tara:strand:+ start:355 stop:1098 length:744 start_codon:yes stop_codon:yes gene_type:complete